MARRIRFLLVWLPLAIACGADSTPPTGGVDTEPLPPVTATSTPTIAATDSLLEPGASFSIRGSRLSPVTVSIGGVRASVLTASNTAVTVTVPSALWTPCRAAGTMLRVVVVGPAGDSSVTIVPAVERVFEADLAVGASVEATPAATSGCRIRLAHKGTYLALPYRPQLPLDEAVLGDSVSVTVRLGDGPSRMQAPMLARSAWHATVARRETGGSLPPDVLVARGRSGARAVACSPPALGDVIPVATARDAEGFMTGLAPARGSTTPVEPWIVVAQGRSVVVLIDSSTARMARGDPRWSEAAESIVALSDTSVVPFLERSYRGLPDRDGNGKLMIYVSGAARSPSFAIFGNLRADCLAAEDAGEGIFLNADNGGEIYGPYISEVTLAHEISHVVDLGHGDRGTKVRGGWSVEGFATLGAVLYMERARPDIFTMNRDTVPRSWGGFATCAAWPTSLRSGPRTTGWMYSTGCNMVSYLVKRYHARFGGTLKDALTAWAGLRSTDTMDDAQAMLRLPPTAPPTFGSWLLSLYADEYVQGAPPELSQPMWNTRKLWSWWFAEEPDSPYPFPDVRLAESAPAIGLKLGAPSAYYVEIEASSDATSLHVTQSDGQAADARLLLLRAR